jgi:chromosomal replication initiation ATPase DnaA
MIGRTARRMAIIDEVAAAHDLTRADLLSNIKVRLIVRARDEAIARLRAETGDSLLQIAAFLGRPDHTSIWAALNRQTKRAKNAAWARKTHAANTEAQA